MKKQEWKGVVLLLITAILWGSTFIFQKLGAEIVGPFTFNALRSIIGITILLVIVFIRKYNNKKKGIVIEKRISNKKKYGFAILAGAGMFFGSSLQQIGLESCDAGTAAFLTSVYMVLVPVVGIAFGKKVKLKIWLCVILSLIGAYLLANDGGSLFEFNLSPSGLIVLGGSLFWALQINSIDMIANDIDSFELCAIEIGMMAILSSVLMFIKEDVTWIQVRDVLPCVLYAGIFSSVIAYSLQGMGQKYIDPTRGTLIMELESPFALIFGMLFLNEKLTIYSGIGSLLTFIAIVIASVNLNKIFRKQINNNIE